MNCCNFVKVILARATKDKAQIDHFNSESDNDSIKAQYNNSLPLNIRYDNYTTFMQTFPKMHINSYIYFCQKVPLIQNYVYKNTYYTTNNKNGEKSRFVNHFSLQSWLQLTNSQKHGHQLENCNECNTHDLEYSILHKAVPLEAKNTYKMSQDLTTNISQHTISRNPSNKGIKVAKSMVNILNPVFEKEFGYTFQKAMIEAHNLSPQESSKEKGKKVEKSVRQTKQSITKSIEENDKDATILLSMGKSYSQYERERLGLCYQSKTDAEKSMLKRNEQELDGKVKPKKHHGKYTNYCFDKDTFLEEMKKKPQNAVVNWTKLATKYNLKSLKSNDAPGNGGQVLMNFAKDNGIEINKLNTHMNVSGRDILHRIRRSKKRALNSRVSIPTPRLGRVLKQVVKKKVEQGIIRTGIDIAPKSFEKNVIGSDGKLNSLQHKQKCMGKKYPYKT